MTNALVVVANRPCWPQSSPLFIEGESNTMLIELRDIDKTYTLGEVEVNACGAFRWTSIRENTWP